ncbi:acyclic terpene utilization AtuA family protein [Paraburkholderia fungorum]|uniref:acyclic terpene utilization AtuA family protein n=1 Tax=Paraburkholderia fungorum TaxID=134537 RepID=UPI0038BDF9EF
MTSALPSSAAPEVRVLAATGVCGSGFNETSFQVGLMQKPTFIGCDCGSTDPGPTYLGTGATAFPRASIKRDLRLMLLGARSLGVPLLLGSAGTAGADSQVDFVQGIVEEIAEENGLSFNLATIRGEVDKAWLKQKYRDGKILPLDPAPELDEQVIERSAHIVGMMGAEPYIRAIQDGADVVIAGRASDTAIYASIPLMLGIPPGVAWHAAKILECGAAAVVNRKTPDCMFAWLRDDHFVMQAPAPELRCTPQSIASHALYENAHPFRLVESSGTLDLTDAIYTAVDDRTVRVEGSRFEPASTYTVKLEGAEFVGYQSVLIGSVRDPYIIAQIDDWTAELQRRIANRVHSVFGDKLGERDWSVNIRIYGKNGTMGSLEPVKEIRGHELCLVFEATAPTQETANALGGIVRHQALHLPIPEWSGLITAVACPYNALQRGAVYRFNLNHVVIPDTPDEMFRTTMTTVSHPNKNGAAIALAPKEAS